MELTLSTAATSTAICLHILMTDVNRAYFVHSCHIHYCMPSVSTFLPSYACGNAESILSMQLGHTLITFKHLPHLVCKKWLLHVNRLSTMHAICLPFPVYCPVKTKTDVAILNIVLGKSVKHCFAANMNPWATSSRQIIKRLIIDLPPQQIEAPRETD